MDNIPKGYPLEGGYQEVIEWAQQRGMGLQLLDELRTPGLIAQLSNPELSNLLTRLTEGAKGRDRMTAFLKTLSASELGEIVAALDGEVKRRVAAEKKQPVEKASPVKAEPVGVTEAKRPRKGSGPLITVTLTEPIDSFFGVGD